MYRYDQYDQTIVDERVAQYRDQTQRYLAGTISEEEFLPLRLQNGLYVPYGYEVGVNPDDIQDQTLADQFLLITDDNRKAIEFSEQRIEKRERMINGRMRSYHIADKLSISLTWENLPSRSHGLYPTFNSSGKTSLIDEGLREPGTDSSFSQLPNITIQNQQYTTDGGAGGAELLDWYENQSIDKGFNLGLNLFFPKVKTIGRRHRKLRQGH